LIQFIVFFQLAYHIKCREEETLRKYIPLVFIYLLICTLAIPSDTLAPDSKVNPTIFDRNKSFFNKGNIFGIFGNSNVSQTNSEEDLLSEIDTKQLVKFHKENDYPIAPVDSMSIWREWYSFGEYK
jgi:hypothetical protein